MRLAGPIASQSPKGVTTAAIVTKHRPRGRSQVTSRVDLSTPLDAVESARRKRGHSELTRLRHWLSALKDFTRKTRIDEGTSGGGGVRVLAAAGRQDHQVLLYDNMKFRVGCLDLFGWLTSTTLQVTAVCSFLRISTRIAMRAVGIRN